jgi:hypothetical protein
MPSTLLYSTPHDFNIPNHKSNLYNIPYGNFIYIHIHITKIIIYKCYTFTHIGILYKKKIWYLKINIIIYVHNKLICTLV